MHSMNMLWEKFQWILSLYMKPISLQSKASVVFLVTTGIFMEFCLKKLNVFSQNIWQKRINIWITQNKSQGIRITCHLTIFYHGFIARTRAQLDSSSSYRNPKQPRHIEHFRAQLIMLWTWKNHWLAITYILMCEMKLPTHSLIEL